MPDTGPSDTPPDRPPLRERRPGLYASRHVARALLRVGLVALGVGALLRGLLPRFDLGWLRDWRPSWDVSWIPDPIGWLLGHLPTLTVPGWLEAVGRTARFWLPVVLAVLVALHEVERRRTAATGTDGDAEGDAP